MCGQTLLFIVIANCAIENACRRFCDARNCTSVVTLLYIAFQSRCEKEKSAEIDMLTRRLDLINSLCLAISMQK